MNAELKTQRAAALLILAFTTLSSLTFLLTSCGFFSRSQSRFYSLERIPPDGPVASVAGLPIGIDSLELPPGFDRRDIVVRKPDLQLDVRGTEQWSASLEPMILHTLAFDLAGRLPEGMVILPGQAKPAGPMRAIDVVVEEITAGPGNEAVLDARWVLRQGGQPTLTRHERITIPLQSLQSEHVASGFSQAVATLANRIAAQLSTS
jgi:uncharacterized lipoprotein YmbA